MQKHVLNIDWLTIYGSQHLDIAKEAFKPEQRKDWNEMQSKSRKPKTKHELAKEQEMIFLGKKQHFFGNIILDVMEYGTRIYNVLAHIYIGRERFGVFCAFPRSKKGNPNAFTLKVDNMWLYKSDCWSKLAYVIGTLHLEPHSISRLDIAADFNLFHGGLHPIEFIRRFMASEIKHKGRAQGKVYFRQEKAPSGMRVVGNDVLNFNALEIGKRTSDAHCYLYNKSLELREETKKPWIEDCWIKAGLNPSEVWRLEVSMKSEALKFPDKNSGECISFNLGNIMDPGSGITVSDLYFTMMKSLFFFYVPGRDTNVSRYEMIQLFDEEVQIDRGTYREKNPSDRAERVFIKKLYTFRQRYRNIQLKDEFRARMFAQHLVETMNLQDWYEQHRSEWEREKIKV